MDRRTFVATCGSLLAGCVLPKATFASALQDPAAILDTLGPGVRLGMAAMDAGNGRTLWHDGESRYAMCSVFKVPLAAAVLSMVDRSTLSLSRMVPFGAQDLLDYAPVVRAHESSGKLTVAELCAAAVEVSDNSAANLLLPLVGGPAGLSTFMRNCGDRVSRLDRFEPDLNTNLAGDPRDTTTPAAMIALLHQILIGRVLSPRSRDQLVAWMTGSTTGLGRIRAGLPGGWRAGAKSGTGMNGAVNDVAIFWPPGRSPILLATFISGGNAPLAEREAAHASVARYMADAAVRGFPA